MSGCLMASDVSWHVRDKLWPMPKHSSIKATYVRCMRVLAVTCHLHFWQNDRDFLRATAVTRGWNGYRNKSQHRKSTLEKKILPLFQQGFEPATFQSRVRRSNHWAIPAPAVHLTDAFIASPGQKWKTMSCLLICTFLPSIYCVKADNICCMWCPLLCSKMDQWARCCSHRNMVTVRWVDPQADGNVGDAFVLTRQPVRLLLDLFTNQAEVSELLPFGVDKLGILCTADQGSVVCEKAEHSWKAAVLYSMPDLENNFKTWFLCIYIPTMHFMEYISKRERASERERERFFI